ncbi:uncharacterized protein LOC113557361 [Rhopalosiphum maidis]|uniref:uncharacterized protein LOC113557361 n=1 Tax=Rhopalosiphum maidis TaxID=43146 RepID=UPI000EFEFD9D|nr:uncharacterized protein LOC113557361 [Rhopalosiphum maidis]
MNKLLSIAVLLTVTVCSCHGNFNRRSIRSAGTEVSVNVDDPIDTIASRDSAAADTFDVFTARAKKGGHKSKMEAMHMGLSYVKMVLSTLMAAIGHVFAFKSVGLSLISVLIQIAQFIMVLKKNRDSQPPSYKIVETPWHTSPTESYGAYGSYAGHAKSAAAVDYSAYAAALPARRRR